MNTGDFDSTPAPWERSSLALPQSSTELRELQEFQPELGEKVQDIIKNLSNLILDFWPERPLQACEPMFKLLAAEVHANINFRLHCGQTQPETSVQFNNQLTKPVSTETKSISTETKPRSTSQTAKEMPTPVVKLPTAVNKQISKARPVERQQEATSKDRRSPSLDFIWNSKHWSSLLQEVSFLVLDTTDENDIEELYKLLLQNLQPHQCQCIIRVKPDPLHIREVAHSVYKDLCVIHPDSWLRYMAYMDPTCVGTQITECIIKRLEIPQQIQSIQKPESPEVSSEDSVGSSGAGFMLDQWRDLLDEVSSQVLGTKNVTQIEEFSQILLPHLLKQNSHRVNQVMPERSDFVGIAKRVHKDLCCTRPKSSVPKLAYADPGYCSQIVECIFKQIEMPTKKPISTETKPISTETKPRSTSQTAKEMPTPMVTLPTAVNKQLSPQRWAEATAAVKNILEQMGLEILMEEQDSEPENNQETKTSPKPETMDSRLMLVYETALEMRAAQRKCEQNCRTAKPERPDQREQTAAAPTSKRTTEPQEQVSSEDSVGSSGAGFMLDQWRDLLDEVSSRVLGTKNVNEIEQFSQILLPHLLKQNSHRLTRIMPERSDFMAIAKRVHKDLCRTRPKSLVPMLAYADPSYCCQIVECVFREIEMPTKKRTFLSAFRSMGRTISRWR